MKRLLLLLWLGLAWPVAAHESLPASLLIEQTAPQEFSASWRLPASRGGSLLALEPRFASGCKVISRQGPERAASTQLIEYRLQCEQGLAEASIAFPGLEASLVNVLVRINYTDGQRLTAVASPREPQVRLVREQAQRFAASGYWLIGVEHILGGPDHLLFVFCLVLLVRTRWGLLKTITAFTLAHSLTLAAASMGYVQLASLPVEANIALSILFLARELLRPQQAGRRASPWWLVAFAFGLLHGLGFAGALAEVGLPQGEIPLALLLFNLGVEAGQLLFVAGVLALRALLPRQWQVLGKAPAYAVGAMAGFWFVQRMFLLLGWQAL